MSREARMRPTQLGVGTLVGWSTRIGLGTLVFGGLFVYGSSTGLSWAKTLYAGSIFVIGSLTIPTSLRTELLRKDGRGIQLVSILLLSSLSIGTVLGPIPDAVEALRQGLFYLLVPLAPFIGIGLGARLTNRFVSALVLIAGILSAISFGVDWLMRRQVGSLDFGRIVFGSPVLSALGFALAAVLSVHGRRLIRLLATAAVVIIPVSLLVTGTRTNLIIFLVPFALIGARRNLRLSASNTFWVLILCIASIGLLVLVAPLLLQDPSFLQVRADGLAQVLSGYAQSDQSFVIRSLQYEYAYSNFQRSPLFGMGFGWVPEMSLDTPVAIPARVGIIGTMLLLVFLIQCLALVRRAGARYGPNPFNPAALGLGVFIVALIPFGAPIEDHGFAIALVALFAGIASRIPSEAPYVGQPMTTGARSTAPTSTSRAVRPGHSL